MRPERKTSPAFNVPAVFKGTLYTLATSGLLIGLAGLTFYFTDLAETTLNWLAGAILFLSTAVGSTLAAREAGGRGLFHGLTVSVVYFLVLWACAAWFLPGPLQAAALLRKLILIVAGGAAGGIFGVGLANSGSRSTGRG